MTVARTILIVEDDLIIGIDLEMFLEEEGFKVIGPVATVKDALSFIQDSAIDHAVLDVDLLNGRSYPVADAPAASTMPF